MTADVVATPEPTVVQTAYFQATEWEWRGEIYSEDLTLANLAEALQSAADAGMPAGSSVEIRPADCVIKVCVKHRSLHTVPRRDEVSS